MGASASSLPKEIYVAAHKGELQEVVEWLRKGGRVDALYTWEDEQHGNCSRGLLHAAAANGQLAAAKVLLKGGAAVDLLDLPGSIGSGSTPLMHAAAQGHVRALALLITRVRENCRGDG